MNDKVDDARWAGRNANKDVLRRRVWTVMEENNVSIGRVASRIPNFAGATAAAELLARLPMWEHARVVKTNPDAAQAPIRLRALRDGKTVYTPVPELVMDFPFVELDPAELTRHGIPFEAVMYSEDFVRRGKPVQFEGMPALDIVVVGCVAVSTDGGRTGKGGGFADLELGIFREVGIVTERTPIVTTVHPLQIVDNGELPLDAHDSVLDWIITADEVIETHRKRRQPTGVDWTAVRPDQMRDIPFLSGLRQRIRAVGEP